MFTKELAEHHIKKTAEFNAMTPPQRRAYYRAKMSNQRRGRPRSKLTPEERKEKNREAQKVWYAKNKEKRTADQRARRLKKKAALIQPTVECSTPT